jgi:hypothetical protein
LGGSWRNGSAHHEECLKKMHSCLGWPVGPTVLGQAQRSPMRERGTMAKRVLASALGGSRLLGQGGGAGLAAWAWAPARWATRGGPATRAVGASQGRGAAGSLARAAAREREQDAGGRRRRVGRGGRAAQEGGERATIGENEGERILGFFFYVPLLFFVHFSSSLSI